MEDGKDWGLKGRVCKLTGVRAPSVGEGCVASDVSRGMRAHMVQRVLEPACISSSATAHPAQLTARQGQVGSLESARWEHLHHGNGPSGPPSRNPLVKPLLAPTEDQRGTASKVS